MASTYALLRPRSVLAVFAAQLSAAAFASSLAGQQLASPRVPLAMSLTAAGTTNPESSELYLPFFVELGDSAAYTYDGGKNQILAFNFEGTLLWSFGRKGDGPGEFRSVWDFKLGRDGRLYAYDDGTLRVTVVEPNGTLHRTVRIANRLDRFLPLPDGTFLGHSEFVSPFLLRFDSTGKRVAELPAPAELRGRDPIQTQIRTAVGPQKVDVVASSVTDRFYLINPSDLAVRAFRGIEPLEYPSSIPVKVRITKDSTEPGYRPAPTIRYTARTVSMDSRFVYVLMGNASPYPNRLVDVYRQLDGGYAGTFILPVPAVALSIRGSMAVTLHHDPAPQLRFWRLVRRQ